MAPAIAALVTSTVRFITRQEGAVEPTYGIPSSMPRRRASGPVATLWQLAWNGDRLSCAVYRSRRGDALEMRLESQNKTILAEPFELRPRVIARMDALKRSLKRRGWRDSPQD
jgi:hypothetical protein